MKQIMASFRISHFSFIELRRKRRKRRVAANYTLDILISSAFSFYCDEIFVVRLVNVSTHNELIYWLAWSINLKVFTLCHPRWVRFDFRHPFVVCWESIFPACWSRYIKLLVCWRLLLVLLRGVADVRYLCSQFHANDIPKGDIFSTTIKILFPFFSCLLDTFLLHFTVCLPESNFRVMIHMNSSSHTTSEVHLSCLLSYLFYELLFMT